MFKTFLILATVKNIDSQHQNIEGRVIGGQHVNINNYPHSVVLDMSSTYSCICGGSILNQDIMLTAAHCFEGYLGRSQDTVMIKYGASARSHMSYVSMLYYKVHDSYDETTMSSDLALLRCKTPLKLGNNAMRVAIMVSPPSTDTAYVSGWGTINKELLMAKSLKHTVQKLQPAQVCNKYLDMPRGSFCAGPIHGDGHPNEGDSGSALVIQKFIQIGIVSFREHKYDLTVYTNISYFYRWITNNSVNAYCAKRRN